MIYIYIYNIYSPRGEWANIQLDPKLSVAMGEPLYILNDNHPT